MKGEILESHLESKEYNHFDKSIDVYVIHSAENLSLVSQFTKTERFERELHDQKKLEASQKSNVGEVYQMVISEETAWGYICKQVDGYLEGAVRTNNSLELGEILDLEIISKTKIGAPLFKL